MADYLERSKRQLLRSQPPQRSRNRRMRGSDRRRLQLESQQVASEISRLERFIRAPRGQKKGGYHRRLQVAIPAERTGGPFASPLSGPIRLEMHRQRRARLGHLMKFLFWLFVLLAFCGWLVYWSAMV
jgi:hypothetical protein